VPAPADDRLGEPVNQLGHTPAHLGEHIRSFGGLDLCSQPRYSVINGEDVEAFIWSNEEPWEGHNARRL
jgi:hypothetical protein